MKAFLSILLGLFLLCCSAHARFAHSKQYLAMEQEKLRNQLTMEQNWANKFSHVQTDAYSTAPRICQFLRPQQSGAAIQVCSVDNGAVCHQTGLFKCCEDEELRGRDFTAGGHTLNVGPSQEVKVNFFYSGGGFGSGQPLGFCFTIDGSDGVCGEDLFGCTSEPTCGPSGDICLGNIIEGTCNPDPDPARGGGCTCQRGYLAPNCCLCDFPNFYERRSGAGQSTCEELCRENCDGAPTRLGCSRCRQGYQGTGCCECAPGYSKVGDRCEPVCEDNCATGFLDRVTRRCSRCKTGFASEPTCCGCAEGYVNDAGRCVMACESKCASGFDALKGCDRCKTGYRAPDCCECDHHYFKVNGVCERVCANNCVRDKYIYERGCIHCKEGYGSEPLCCGCAAGFAWQNNRCIPVCTSNCVEGAFGINGCGLCKAGYRGEPECCECAEGFSRNADGECVREVCDRQCVPGTFDPQNGCGQCRLGFAGPTCCDCQLGFVKVGEECLGPCRTSCQPGFFTDGIGCAAGRCRVGHEAPPLCCNCTDGFTQRSPREPCTRIIICRPDQRLENGVCVNICPDPLVFNEQTGECDALCGGDEDLVFLLDYSTSFQPQDLRGILGNLQLISNASNSRPNIRDAVIHYRIRPSRIRPNQGNTLSGYIYDYDDTCEDTVNQLDKFAERNFMDGNRSFRTESYTALNFVARQLPFAPGRRTSIITITDGFSSSDDRISLIEGNIAEIKKRASDANARVRFFSIGIRSQEDLEETIKDIREELKALADGDGREDNYINYAQFKNYLLNLLVNANILCPAEKDSINSETSVSALNSYIDCTDGGTGCGFSKLKISCSNAEAMAMENKGSLMTEILAAVQGVFNDAFKTE